jgi:bacterioferritin
MKGDARLIEGFNEILTGELTGINQYFIHSMMCQNWGYERLSEKIRAESIGEMNHAERIIERILHLEGVPNLTRLEKIRVGERVLDQLQFDRDVETVAIERFNRMIALAVEVGDNGSRQVLEEMLASEEEHLHWLESQLELIEQVGRRIISLNRCTNLRPDKVTLDRHRWRFGETIVHGEPQRDPRRPSEVCCKRVRQPGFAQGAMEAHHSRCPDTFDHRHLETVRRLVESVRESQSALGKGVPVQPAPRRWTRATACSESEAEIRRGQGVVFLKEVNARYSPARVIPGRLSTTIGRRQGCSQEPAGVCSEVRTSLAHFWSAALAALIARRAAKVSRLGGHPLRGTEGQGTAAPR